MRNVLLFALGAVAVTASDTAGGNCTDPIIKTVEWYFKAPDLKGVANTLLGKVQADCKAGGGGLCERVDVSSDCKNQSINDINCEMKNIFSTSVKLGTDDICDAGCDDWPCKAGCNGLDTGICYTSDWILCKAGCLGISSCVHKCEHAIVDPCKQKLIDDCSKKCEATFSKCKSACLSKLTMQISGDFERLQNAITSMSISTLDVNCSHGWGIPPPLEFQSKAAVSINGAALDLKVHISDVGIDTTTAVNLQKIAMTLAVPLSGDLKCELLSSSDHVTVQVGQPTVTDFNLDVDLTLDKTLDTIAAVACADLPFCKDAIKKQISSTIKSQIESQVPKQIAANLQPALQKTVSQLKCPKLEKQAHADDAAVVV
jgi:hypothetical protein